MQTSTFSGHICHKNAPKTKEKRKGNFNTLCHPHMSTAQETTNMHMVFGEI
jgi:hypothetical protein